MRFVVKPSKFRKTPLLLKRALGAQKLVSFPGRFQPALDYHQDLFLAFPQIGRYPNRIDNVPESYEFLSAFYSLSKHAQRGMILQSGLKTPEGFASSHFIVRPLRHFGGHDYRITSNPNDYNPTTQYISPAVEKWREYRVLFVLGSPLIILRKKPGPDAGPFDAWNHASGSFFQTIHDHASCQLSRSTFFTDAGNFCVLRDSHLVAVDVLLDRNFSYAVTEVNFSPAVSIEANIEVIRNAFAAPESEHA
jgi:hypothetical protein